MAEKGGTPWGGRGEMPLGNKKQELGRKGKHKAKEWRGRKENVSNSSKGEAAGTISLSYASSQDRSFHRFSLFSVRASPTPDHQGLALFNLTCGTLSQFPSSETQAIETQKLASDSGNILSKAEGNKHKTLVDCIVLFLNHIVLK